jgi:CHAT domain-containing protein
MVVAVAALVLAGAYVGASARWGGTGGDPSDGTLVARLRRLPAPGRALVARVSLPQAYRACTESRTEPGAPSVPFCGAHGPNAAPPGLIALLADASARSRRHADPDAMHVLALVDLLWADGSAATLDRAIGTLRTVARLAPRRASALADLSAALLMRAERRGEARDVFEGAEMAALAVSADSADVTARFDLALALTRLGLVDEAVRAWDEYLAAEPRGPWAEEARWRRAEVVAAAAPPRFLASDPDVRGAVARAPQEARLYGWNEALHDWGNGVLAGDSVRAARSLAAARAIGRALEARGGDATLADAVRVIDTARGSAVRTRALAEGHRAFAEAYAEYSATRYAEAAPGFARAVDAPGPLGLWARAFAAGTRIYVGQPGAAYRELRDVIAHADSTRYAALVARGRWMLGHLLNRLGRTEEALHQLRASASDFARVGETEHLGAVQSLGGRTTYLLGDSRATAEAVRDALTTLRAYSNSVWRYNALYMAALAAERDGLGTTALRVQDEAVKAGAQTGNAILAADAQVVRARLALRAGLEVQTHAVRDAAAAREGLAAARPGVTRDWVVSDLRVVEAAMRPERERGRSLAALDSVVTLFERPLATPRLVPALLARADARLLTGDTAGSGADLRRAVALLAAQQRMTDSLPLRASLVDAARAVVDRAVMYQLHRGMDAEALEQLELGRVGLAPVGARLARTARPRVRASSGEVVLVYALVGDTLLTWTVRDTTVRMSRATTNRSDLGITIQRARAALERRTTDEAQADLASLYDRLIAPVAARLGPPGTRLMIVADGEIRGVPFAALLDRRRGQFLMQDHPIRIALSVRDGLRAPVPHARPAVMPMLVVADPAFDRAAFPSLGALVGARAEERIVAETYGDVRRLSGVDATTQRVAAELPRAALFHYAGHAVFDDERPGRSLLLLAAREGGASVTDAVGLRAEQIAALDLRHVRLVVLSACETLRSTTGRGDGFSGLTGAFTAAGVGGVVGALWRVDDDATTALMRAFHQAYARGGDAAAALRAAQLELLHSQDPARRSPAAWGAFEYVGR